MIVSLYDCFKPWSAKGSVFIISDTHFDDIDISFMGYNISEQEQMNILKKYLSKARQSDLTDVLSMRAGVPD